MALIRIGGSPEQRFMLQERLAAGAFYSMLGGGLIIYRDNVYKFSAGLSRNDAIRAWVAWRRLSGQTTNLAVWGAEL